MDILVAHPKNKRNSSQLWRYSKRPVDFSQNAEVNRVEELTIWKNILSRRERPKRVYLL